MLKNGTSRYSVTGLKVVALIAAAAAVTVAVWLILPGLDGGLPAQGAKLSDGERPRDYELAERPEGHEASARTESRGERQIVAGVSEALGKLSVTVKTRSGSGVQCTVNIASLGSLEGGGVSKASDAAGRVQFGELSPGVYGVRVLAESIPPGYVAPWGKESPLIYSGDSHGPFHADAHVEGGGRAHVELILHPGARVYGFIVDEEGAPLMGAMARLQSQADSSLAYWGEAAADGYYSVESIRPGAYVGSLEFPPHALGPQRSATLSAIPTQPRFFAISSGEGLRMDLDARPGPVSVTGRVVEADGTPVPGVQVVFRQGDLLSGGGLTHNSPTLGYAQTDAQGAYTLDGLHQEHVFLCPGYAEFMPMRPALENRLTGWVEPTYLDLSVTVGTEHVDPIVVDVNRPFVVQGLVRIDPDFSRTHDVDLDDMILTLIVGVGQDQVRRKVSVDPRTGAFSVGCESSHRQALLRLRDVLELAVERETDLAVVPGGREEGVLLRYP